MKIACIPGDGVGKEITKEMLKIVSVFNTHFKTKVTCDIFPFGGEYFVKHGKAITNDFLHRLQNEYRGVFIGSLGDSSIYTQNYISQIHHSIFETLDLSLNIKPIILFNESLTPLRGIEANEIKTTFYRESINYFNNLSGARKRKHTDSELTSDTIVYSYINIKNILTDIFNHIIYNKENTVYLVQRNKLFPNGSVLWEQVFTELIDKNDDLHGEILELPHFLSSFFQNPKKFNNIISPGATGEILSETLLAMTNGKYTSLSAFTNSSNKFLVEPLHGPMPTIAEKNRVLPFATFHSLGLIYEFLGMRIPAKLIRKAIFHAFENKWLTIDFDGSMNTDSIGDFMASYIDEELKKIPRTNK